MNFKDLTHPKQKGEATEAIIIAELLRRGLNVLKPIGDNLPFDLVVFNSQTNTFYKCQCRTARKAKQSKSHSFIYSNVSTRINSKGNYKTSLEGKIDYFLVFYPGTNKVYVVDADEDYPTTLRIDKTLNGQNVGISMAVDFELDNNWVF
jgi:hypothetical protein